MNPEADGIGLCRKVRYFLPEKRLRNEKTYKLFEELE